MPESTQTVEEVVSEETQQDNQEESTQETHVFDRTERALELLKPKEEVSDEQEIADEPEVVEAESGTKTPDSIPFAAYMEEKRKRQSRDEENQRLKEQLEALEANEEAESPKDNAVSEDQKRYLDENSDDPVVQLLKKQQETIDALNNKLQYHDTIAKANGEQEARQWLDNAKETLHKKYPKAESAWSEESETWKKFLSFAGEKQLVSDEDFEAGFKGFFADDLIKAASQEAVEKVLKKKTSAKKAGIGNPGTPTGSPTSMPYSDRTRRALELLATKNG